ncbi:MAG: DUF4625 domain-containing protein [Flavobacteriales bacterium]|nr:DUF4625 domain-containing protein [Flavobacteriales bacterium]
MRYGPFLLLTALLLLFLAACSDGFDLERPVTELLSPVNGQNVTTAEGIPLNVRFTDNGNLLQYKIRVEGIDSLNSIAKDTTLRLVFIEGITGSEFLLNQIIPLPDSTFNGHYRVILTCIDDDGNESYPDTASIRITNSLDSIPPVFDVGGLPADTLRLGQGFTLAGSVTDETSLNYVTIRIGNVNGSFVKLNFQFPNIIDNTVDLNGFGGYLMVDSTWTNGTYSMHINAWDDYSGVSSTSYFQVKR